MTGWRKKLALTTRLAIRRWEEMAKPEENRKSELSHLSPAQPAVSQFREREYPSPICHINE